MLLNDLLISRPPLQKCSHFFLKRLPIERQPVIVTFKRRNSNQISRKPAHAWHVHVRSQVNSTNRSIWSARVSNFPADVKNANCSVLRTRREILARRRKVHALYDIVFASAFENGNAIHGEEIPYANYVSSESCSCEVLAIVGEADGGHCAFVCNEAVLFQAVTDSFVDRDLFCVAACCDKIFGVFGKCQWNVDVQACVEGVDELVCAGIPDFNAAVHGTDDGFVSEGKGEYVIWKIMVEDNLAGLVVKNAD